MDIKLGSSSKIFPTNLFQTSDYTNVSVPLKQPSRKFKRNLDSSTRFVLNDKQYDLLYVDDLTDEEAIVCLLRRYLGRKYFTYFGTVLFYIQPLDKDPLHDYSNFIYSEFSDSHLFPFLKELFISLAREKSGPRIKSNQSVSVDDLVRMVSRTVSSIGSSTNTNSNVFFYGDDNFGQLQTTQTSLKFLVQFVHSLGLEPTGTLNNKLYNAFKILDSLSDYTDNSRLCNYMATYKLNFNDQNHLRSITLVPNFATDLSCCVVSNLFRETLLSNLTSFYPKLNVRYPSLFYGLLYSISKDQICQWAPQCKLTKDLALKALQYIPSHESKDPNYHTAHFAKMMELFTSIGFTKEDVKNIINILGSVVMLDIYSILKDTGLGHSPLSSVQDRLDSSASDDSKSKSSSADNGSAAGDEPEPSVELSKKVLFFGLDLLELILDLLDIDLLTRPNSDMKYNDILFKYEILSNARSKMFDSLSSALFLRLKHMIYLKLNSYLSSNSHTTTKSLSLHCNSGFNPYSNFIKFSNYHLPWFFSEEFFMNKMLKTLLNDLSTSPYLDFVVRNFELVDSATSRSGFLSKLILETVTSNKYLTKLQMERTVVHSWDNITYNIGGVIDIDSTIYSVAPMFKSLLKYSKNEFLSLMFFSNGSLHQSVGNCALSLGYHFYLNESLKDTDPSYFVVCSTPVDFSKSNYQDRFNIVSFDETAEILMNSFTNKLPLLDLCNLRRNLDLYIVPVEEYINQYIPLVYMLTNYKYHCTVAKLSQEQLVHLLFSLLSVSENVYRTSNGVLSMKKTLHTRVLALLKDYMNSNLQHIVSIQRWWKDHRMPLVRRRLIKLVTRTQSLARMHSVVKQARLSKDGKATALNFIGLVATVFHLNTCLNSTNTKTQQLLHQMEKQFHEKEYEYLQHSAATYIQAIWRGSIERRKYMLVKQNRFEEFAIILIQSSIRKILASSQILNVRNTKSICAVMIQSYFRGYLTRKKYQSMMQLKLLLLPILKKGSKINSMGDQINFIKLYKDHDSLSLQMKRLISVQTNLPPGFIKVQNLVRMHFIRKQYLNLKGCLEKVQALAMTKHARLSYLEKVKAAVKIQRWWRCVNKDSFPSINTNPIYYINTKEQASLNVLAKELKALDVHIFHFNIYQDIRRIYPNTWAMMPLAFVKNIKYMQKSSADLNYTQIRKIEYVKFSVGSTHSLMLISTNNGSCVYSWGWNDKGQLGRRNLYPLKPSDNDFMLMEPLEFEDEYKDKLYEGVSDRINIVEIACGNDFSMALSARGRLFTWGDNSLGQCGHGRRLMRVHDPTPLDLVGVESLCCASYHSIIFVSGEYYVFGNAFDRLIFKPLNVKSFVPHLKNQTIRKVVCAGTTTLMYTNELDYVLNVFSQLHNFQSMYNLKGTIKSFCTNGKMICAIVEISRGENENADTKVYVIGHVRCVVSQEKSVFTSKSLFVGAFKEKFENLGKKKTKQSLLNVYSTHGNTCHLQHPTEVLLPKEPLDVFCDHQQLIFTTNTGVYGTKIFQIISQSSSDFEIRDNCTIDVKNGSNIKLEPSLYQFTNITKKRAPVYISSNSLSHSIGYTY